MSNEKLQNFLTRNKLTSASLDRETFITRYTDEMEKGLCGQESSLEMVPTYVTVTTDIPQEKELLVIDAGGTNLRITRAKFITGGKIELSGFEKYRMPGTDGKITSDEFFTRLADLVYPVLGEIDKIGFCFSYPSEITPDLDGKVLRLVKEIQVEGLEGQFVARNLLAGLKERGASENLSMVIVNDSVTSLLSGLTIQSDITYDGYVGLILGTGSNISYPETTENITKLDSLPAGSRMVINMESANFNKYGQGPIDHGFDAGTAAPGVHVLEKMISGAYLGDLVLLAVKTASGEDIFSEKAAGILKSTKALPTIALDTLLVDKNTLGLPDDDRAVFKQIAEAIIDKAALLTACALSAVIIKSGYGTNPDRPVGLVADGTTFYKLKGLKTGVEKYLGEVLSGDRQRYLDILTVDDGPVVGAAIAGLTN